MNKAYLLIGGNEGDRLYYMDAARDAIAARCGQILTCSALYETAAWGITAQPAFLNQALLIATTQNPEQLMEYLLMIEEDLGRVRGKKYGPRIIDIDILFFNEAIILEPNVTIPHPEIQNRRFVLEPMQEIAPLLVHPVFQKTMQLLLMECPDQLAVKKYE